MGEHWQIGNGPLPCPSPALVFPSKMAERWTPGPDLRGSLLPHTVPPDLSCSYFSQIRAWFSVSYTNKSSIGYFITPLILNIAHYFLNPKAFTASRPVTSSKLASVLQPTKSGTAKRCELNIRLPVTEWIAKQVSEKRLNFCPIVTTRHFTGTTEIRERDCWKDGLLETTVENSQRQCRRDVTL